MKGEINHKKQKDQPTSDHLSTDNEYNLANASSNINESSNVTEHSEQSISRIVNSTIYQIFQLIYSLHIQQAQLSTPVILHNQHTISFQDQVESSDTEQERIDHNGLLFKISILYCEPEICDYQSTSLPSNIQQAQPTSRCLCMLYVTEHEKTGLMCT